MKLLHRLLLRNYLFWAVVIGMILLSALMVWPFVGAIISAYILTYFIRPIFLFLRPRFGTSIGALLCMLITIILVVIPIGVISLEVIKEADEISNGRGITTIIDAFVAQPFLKSLNVDTVGLKIWIALTMNSLVSSSIASIPNFVIGLLITLNGMYFLLCRWDELLTHLKRYLPFKNNDVVITKLGRTAGAIIHGNVLVSLLEAVIAFFGFSLIGVQASLFFAVLIFIFAFMPAIGTELIWGPLAFYYFSTNQYDTMWGVIAIGLVLWVGVEFFFASRFVGSRSHIHPFVMLIGVLGGIGVFGIFGFIIGPLLLVNSIKIIEEAVDSHENGKKQAPMTNLKS
jgi:predicted PurR-regulated permease PerM